MSTVNAAKRVEQAETEIAVLQVRINVIDEKVDELKFQVKDLHDCLDKNMDETKTILRELETTNRKSHDELADKLASMEKIKWMLMGAAAVLGATGVEAFKMIVLG